MRIPLLYILLLVTGSSVAQEKQYKQVSKVQKLNSDSIVFFVEDYKAPQLILTLFKPSDIIMNSDHNPTGQGKVSLKIHVKDSSHSVLKYLKYKASLQVGNVIHPYNIIPKNLNPDQISGYRYYESENHENDVLEVLLSGEEYTPRKKTSYKSEPEIIQFYDIDGKLITREDLQKLNLVLGSFEMGKMIRGKEAVEKYGDPKYATGVQEIRVKKKP